MSLRLTTKMAELLAEDFGLYDVLKNGRFYGYSTSQPADADSAPNGFNCVIFTLDGNAYTNPTRASATITPIGSGTLDTLKVGGKDENLLGASAVTITGVLADDCAAISAAINANKNSLGIVAVDNSTTVEIYAPYWMGADANSLSAAITQTGSTCTIDAAFVGGVDAVNGLTFEDTGAGVIRKPSGENWRGTGIDDLNIGWMRYVAGGYDVSGDGADNVRFDCNVATSGGDLTAGSLVVQTDVLQSIGRLTLTIPRTES